MLTTIRIGLLKKNLKQIFEPKMYGCDEWRKVHNKELRNLFNYWRLYLER